MNKPFVGKNRLYSAKEIKENTNVGDQVSDKNGHHETEKDSSSVIQNYLINSLTQTTRWDELIYIDFQFYLEGKAFLDKDYLWKDEITWDKSVNSYPEIKAFAYSYLFDSIPSTVTRFSLEQFECCCEFITSKILKEVQFYEKYDFFKIIKSGSFGRGNGLGEEHLLPIALDIKTQELTYKDCFDFDLANPLNNPECLAQAIVRDMKLPRDFAGLISLKIRRQIRDYLYYLLGHAYEVSSYFFQKPKSVKKTSSKSLNVGEEEQEHIEKKKKLKEIRTFDDVFLFENKLECELGPLQRFKHTTRDSKFHKPLFLKNRVHNKKRHKLHHKQNSFLLFTDNKRLIISKAIFRHVSKKREFDRIIIEKSKINQYL